LVLESRERIRNLIYVIHARFVDISEPAADVLAKIEQYAHQQG
jgi:hypothetical protein